ncbi:hypothetical protein HDU96_003177 [Phlyctochytrium bullatum]|nr:hypothetical protein HDU96_003177 [Phlyctochytrium bullatum]
MIGLFYEMGPLRLTDDMLLERNPFAWSSEYSMLFIDNPVGTGFSFVSPLDTSDADVDAALWDDMTGTISRNATAHLVSRYPDANQSSNAVNNEENTDTIPRYSKGYVENQPAVARDLMTFLQHFYNLFPDQKDADLYVTGESYAGKYVPHFADAILRHNTAAAAGGNASTSSTVPTTIPLKGIAIGDGLTDPSTQVVTHADHALALGLVSRRQAAAMRTAADTAVTLARQGRWREATAARNHIFAIFANATGGINWYDVRRGDIPNTWAKMELFLSQPEIKRALNVPAWVNFSKDPAVYAHLVEDAMKSAADVVEAVLAANISVLLYQAQFDFRDGIMSCNEWIEGLDWEGRNGFLEAERQIWRVDDGHVQHVAGYVTQHGLLTRAEVLLAGHLAPMDAGKATLDMITRFINYKPWS